VAATDLPARWVAPAVIGCWLLGGAMAFRDACRPRRQLWLTAPTRPLLLDGVELETPTLQCRGPWLQLRWHGPGRKGRLLFWPDVLDRTQRRELRLAVRTRMISRQPPSVAP